MNMEVWQRQDKGRAGLVYDVYVINNPDPNSPFHAGGMPAKWLVMHCASPNEFRAKFPNSVSESGQPLVKSKPDAKPQTTKADVPIEMIVDQEEIEKYVATAEAKVEAESKETTQAKKSESASQPAEKPAKTSTKNATETAAPQAAPLEKKQATNPQNVARTNG